MVEAYKRDVYHRGWQDEYSRKHSDVHIVLGISITKEIAQEMDKGNLYQYQRLDTRSRNTLADIYHEPNPAKIQESRGKLTKESHMQAALARMYELQDKYNDYLPDEEYARLLRLANYGFRVDLGKPCGFYQREEEACRHSVKCRKLHMGYTRMDSACRYRKEERDEEDPWEEDCHYKRDEYDYYHGRGSGASTSSSAPRGRR